MSGSIQTLAKLLAQLPTTPGAGGVGAPTLRNITATMFSQTTPLRGVNLAALELAPGTLPGTFGVDYYVPQSYEVDYYITKGMNLIRLPFIWERLQPTPNTALNSAYLGYIQTFVTYATTVGQTVVLDLHNFGQYFGNTIGSGACPTSQFVDVWTRLATAFASNPLVVFGIMNEPFNVATNAAWLTIQNAAIAGIRGTGATNLIAVCFPPYQGAWEWVSGGASTTIGTGTVDPLNNYVFEVHQYSDPSYSGVYSAPVSSTTFGASLLVAVTTWAQANGARFFLGEFGVPGDTTSVTSMTNMMAYMTANSNAWWGMTYFAGGPWWGGWAGNGSYGIIIEPDGSLGSYVDSPQMGGYKLLDQIA